MSEDKRNGVQDGLYPAGEFETPGGAGSDFVTINERVTRLATVLRQKLKSQIQQYGEEPVRELMPLLVEVLDTLNSALQDDREHVFELQQLKEENEQLLKQFRTEKEKKSQAEQSLICLEDQLAQERNKMKDEMQQLKNTTRQLQAQLKNHRERAERVEQRHEQLQADYSGLQVKHGNMMQQYIMLVRQPAKGMRSRYIRGVSEGMAITRSLNMSLDVGPMTELVQHGSPTAQVLSSSPKAGYSPISGNSPRGGLRSPRNKKNFQREMLEESSNVTKVDARRYSDYTVYESTQMEVTFNSNLLEVDRGLALESESRGAPVGSSDTLSAVGGRPDSMRPLGAEVLAESADELADGQTASIMTGDVEQTDMEMSLKSVDFSDVDKRDEELFAHDKECEVSASGEYGLMNEECLYNEIGHESVAEMDESAEITKVNLEIQELVDENKRLQENRNQISKEHDKLATKIGVLVSEKDGLVEDLGTAQSENSSLQDEIKKLKQLLEAEKQKSASIEAVNPDDQKRYTRLEMAKILEQRDFYKEKFLEMQEDMRLNEETPLVAARGKTEQRSPLFRFFQGLFRKPRLDNVQTDYGSSDAIDPELYAQIRGSSDKGNTILFDSEESRIHAYGWSLPNAELRKSVVGMSLSVEVSGRRLPLPVHPVETFSQPIPVPITAGPLMQQDKNMKVTCAVALNSVEWCCPSVEKVIVPGLDAHIWLCAAPDDALKSNNVEQELARVYVLDANKPTDIVESFGVEREILCAVSVPAFKDQLSQNAELGPTVWLGAVDGLYIHSSVDNRGQSIRAMNVSATILHLLYNQGNVIAGRNNGSVTMFARRPDGFWDWDNYQNLELAERRDVPVGALSIVRNTVWAALDRKVYVLDVKNFKVITHFEAHRHSSVSLMASMGDGVWMAFKTDNSLQLYHAETYESVQDLDVQRHVQRLLDIPVLPTRPSSSVRVVQLILADNALWIGTSNGMILSVPLTLSQDLQLRLLQRAGELRATIRESNLPCCFCWDVRINLHGHTHGIKALVATPSSSSTSEEIIEDGYMFVDSRKTLVVSAGEGSVDFRAKEGTLASVKPIARAMSPTKVVTPECIYVNAWEVESRAMMVEESNETT